MANLSTQFIPPPSETSEMQKRTERRTLLYTLLIVIGVSSVVAIIDGIFSHRMTTLYTLGTMAVVSLVSLFLLLRNIIWPARIVIPLGSLVALSYLVFIGNGIHDIAISGFGIAIILAGMTLGTTGVLLFGGLSALSILIIGIADVNGLIKNSFTGATIPDVIIIASAMVGSSLLLYLILRRLQRSIRSLEAIEVNQTAVNNELKELQVSLEQRVEERTFDLEKANQRAKNRSTQFAAIAQIGKEITSVENIELLLPRVSVLISEQLGFYHVGIFLNDEENKRVVLKASNSEGGHRMLGRGHQLEIGLVGIVGYVARTGIPRIALDTGTDSVFFNNPDLPNTHSEMALPLEIGKRTIGVLDLQSTEPDAFDQEDIETVSVLAAQISVAIENARLFQETRQALDEARQTYRQFVRQEWHQFAGEQPQAGYKYTPAGITPLDRAANFPEIQNAISTGQVQAITDKNGKAKLAIPVKLRGEIIGAIDIRSDNKRSWNQDEIDIAQASAERLALALENARLITVSQKRAAKERTIGDISGKIGSSIDIDTIIATAVEQMGNILPDADITIQFDNKGI